MAVETTGGGLAVMGLNQFLQTDQLAGHAKPQGVAVSPENGGLFSGSPD